MYYIHYPKYNKIYVAAYKNIEGGGYAPQLGCLPFWYESTTLFYHNKHSHQTKTFISDKCLFVKKNIKNCISYVTK